MDNPNNISDSAANCNESLSPNILYDEVYKILILGDTQSGKTSILSTYIPLPYKDTQICPCSEFRSKIVSLNSGTKAKVHIWDVSGELEYPELVRVYYKNLSGAIIIIDLTKKRSLHAAQSWIEELRTQNACKHILLLANKSDICHEIPIMRQIDWKQIEEVAKICKVPFIETNAHDEEEIALAFKGLLERIHEDCIRDSKEEEVKVMKEKETEIKNQGKNEEIDKNVREIGGRPIERKSSLLSIEKLLIIMSIFAVTFAYWFNLF
ncbi:hypothetical protein SteCoe_17260 [Stentor coeruleus]|uniref:Uncharacterized protein n=1 Tax=Stentor coeruleus TaxID=5963 RepID=A0A1R2BZD2_9CILI|nr:hypothetical protein SteCoe_17260 [Stentor coeruleus]